MSASKTQVLKMIFVDATRIGLEQIVPYGTVLAQGLAKLAVLLLYALVVLKMLNYSEQAVSA